MLEPTDYRTPGQYISALLESKGWTHRVLAVVLGVGETIVNKLASDTRRIDGATALLLGNVFGVPPEAFLKLQSDFDLAQARIVTRTDPGLEQRAHLFGRLPISEMNARGWIDAPDVRDTRRVETELVRFFGASSLEEIEILPHAAKKTHVSREVSAPQLAWLYRVKAIAQEMLTTSPYSERTLRASLSALKALLGSEEEVRKIPRIMSEAGVRFIIVESLKSAKIDGVCFWLDDDSPVIAMTLRFDRIDNLWFVLRHEIEHVLRRHGRTEVMFDAELEGARAGTGQDVADEEREANAAAVDFCVSQKALDGFIARKGPYFSERDIIGFARTQNVHPGLVAGQLQRRTGRYDRFRAHLVPIRKLVTRGAMVDGWGDVAPTE